ncbi:helix-turn-helix transcriptional regulator [Marinactinospora rubrisoli]|uniref:Helix-turn-helix transcriptional regulator n=1 Tax=Marinactinospora rubrisoli TaxID=2715399 RepID=A0ABW2KBS8_9ACTN
MDLAELAAFLRSRRDRLQPADVGLATGSRRRVPGLRREEVAQLAGASVDYYTELERGRSARPSEQMLAALARALRLTGDERDHLHHLAGYPRPPVHGPLSHVNPALLGLLDRLEGTPARIMTDLHEPLAQNRFAAPLLGEIPSDGDRRGYRTSFAYLWFADPRETRSRYPAEDHAYHSRTLAADLRAVTARRGGDADVRGMVAELRRCSAEFAELWDRRDVAVRRRTRKRLVHPAVGVIEVDCTNLFSEDGRQRLMWLSAPPGDAVAADQLRLLGIIGAQDLGTEGHAPPVGADGRPRTY